MQLETCSNDFLLEQDHCCSGMLKLMGSCSFEVNFTPDPLCSRGEERRLLFLSHIGTEISVAEEENRGDMLAWEPRLTVLIFLVVKQLVSYRCVPLSVEL